MDNDVVESKLDRLTRCIERIEVRKSTSFETLAEDFDVQDIIVLNLERAVQLCVHIGAHLLAERGGTVPATMAGVFDSLTAVGTLDPQVAARLSRAVESRSIAVREYERIDWKIVFSMVANEMDDFRRFAAAVRSSM